LPAQHRDRGRARRFRGGRASRQAPCEESARQADPWLQRVSGGEGGGLAGASAGSVWAAFERAAAECTERDYLHVPLDACRAYSAEAITLRYGQARERVSALAAALRVAGYGAGHRVAIALDNRPEFFDYFL